MCHNDARAPHTDDDTLSLSICTPTKHRAIFSHLWSKMSPYWSDKAVTTLIDELQTRECLWNKSSPHYKSKPMRKTALEELVEALREAEPKVEADVAALKAKIQGLRNTFREELRKVKKSETTGSGAGDIYVPKWIYFEQCKFLERVVLNEYQGVTNVPNAVEPEDHVSPDEDDNDADGPPAEDKTPKRPKNKRQKTATWMESASEALKELAHNTQMAEESNEWTDFGKDVANTIRNLETKSLRRRAKFAVQQALFNISESDVQPPRTYPPYQQQPPQWQPGNYPVPSPSTPVWSGALPRPASSPINQQSSEQCTRFPTCPDYHMNSSVSHMNSLVSGPFSVSENCPPSNQFSVRPESCPPFGQPPTPNQQVQFEPRPNSCPVSQQS